MVVVKRKKGLMRSLQRHSPGSLPKSGVHQTPQNVLMTSNLTYLTLLCYTA